jgi:hypothetical protein
MSSSINGLAFRITQSLVIFLGVTLVWLFQLVRQSPPELHRVKFGSVAQLVSVIPGPARISPGNNLEFSIRWWLLGPLPEDHNISYKVRNRQRDLAVLDTRAIQTTGQSYSTLNEEGIEFDDLISLAIPADATPGIYEVVAYLYPFNDNQLDEALGSPIFSTQRTLFTVHIAP